MNLAATLELEITDYIALKRTVYRYIERHFAESGNTEFPDLRTIAKQCRLSVFAARQVCEDLDAMFCGEGYSCGRCHVYRETCPSCVGGITVETHGEEDLHV